MVVHSLNLQKFNSPLQKMDCSPIIKGVTKRQRLSDGSTKQYHYSRKQFDITFSSEQEKDKFESRLQSFKQRKGFKSVKEVFEYILESEHEPQNQHDQSAESGFDNILSNAVHENFVCENRSLMELVDITHKHGQICDHMLVPKQLTHNGHVAEMKWHCRNQHVIRWNSSSTLGSQYTINYKMMLAFLCSGMSQAQYERFSEFSKTGTLTSHFMAKAALTFSAVISVVARESIHFALFDEIQSSKNKEEDGISIMTDARHQCRKNSFYTSHVALGQHTHKVLNIQNVNKIEERSSQRHEIVGCEKMYEDFDRRDVKVNIHAHDRNMSVNKVIKSKNSVKNCNERWHAAKPVTKGIKAISSGALKNKGKTWHPELADKGALLRNHVYYSIDNCAGDPSVLRELLGNCVLHFQNIHSNCSSESKCKEDGYIPEFTILRDPVAVRLLTNFIQSTTLYKNASDYVLNRDTFYVESFNNSLLIYLDKRLHYKDNTYTLRMNLAVLNWNEHVDRPFTGRTLHYSEKNIARRRLGTKHYKKKTYGFVSDIWNLFVSVMKRDEHIEGLDLEAEVSDTYEETDSED